MALLADIATGWRDPGALMRAKRGQGEGAMLAVVMGACALIFLAQWPRLARESALDPSVPMEVRVGAALLALVFVLPLILYAVAGISHLLLRRKVDGAGARIALFWALLCAAPLWLLHGLAEGFFGRGAAVNGLGLLVLIGFGWLWWRMLQGVAR